MGVVWGKFIPMRQTLPPRSLAIFVLGLLALVSPSARAQLQVTLQISRVQHIVQEPMSVTVTITNRSGADFVLGGDQGAKWLKFDITDADNRILSTNHTDNAQPAIFAAGQSISRQLLVAPQNVLEQGHYGLKALIFHAPSGKYYESNRVRVQVIEGELYGKSLTFGVPPGFPDAGRTQKYSLLQHQDMNHSYLYVRVTDERSGAMIRTIQLGTLTLFREPQYTLDRLNNLHVMFLTAPGIYRYVVVRPDCTVESQAMHREVGPDRPKLYLTAQNDVVLKGGVVYNPAAERAAQTASKGRSIGEKPPGLQ